MVITARKIDVIPRGVWKNIPLSPWIDSITEQTLGNVVAVSFTG